MLSAIPISFRRATDGDHEIIVAVVDGALREYGLRVLLDSSDIDLTDLPQHYEGRGGRFELIEGAGGEALGVLGWRVAEAGIVELKKLYLSPRARGHGIGRRAVDRVVAFAREAGARAVVLETADVLAAANRLYTTYGFVPVRGKAAASFAVLGVQCDLAYRYELAVTP